MALSESLLFHGRSCVKRVRRMARCGTRCKDACRLTTAKAAAPDRLTIHHAQRPALLSASIADRRSTIGAVLAHSLLEQLEQLFCSRTRRCRVLPCDQQSVDEHIRLPVRSLRILAALFLQHVFDA